MSTAQRSAVPAYLLLAASGVAFGAAVAAYADHGIIAWSRVFSAVLLLVMAAGYAKYARGAGPG